MSRTARILVSAACCLLLVATAVAETRSDVEKPAVAWQQISSNTIAWEPTGKFESVNLVVTGPSGIVFQGEFPAGIPMYFDLLDLNGETLADGTYKFELTATPLISPRVRTRMELARASGDESILAELKAEGLLPENTRQSGVFTIANGVAVDPDLPEPIQGSGSDPSAGGITTQDQVVNDDKIVIGSQCTGFDCVNGESFGFDTHRLKENNLRIHFQDTSSTASFPTEDWGIEINSSANGGGEYFGIVGRDTGRRVFTLEADAPANALYVDSAGDLGLGTSTPVVDLHIVSGNTPTLRLEQNGTSGFTPQTWDVAGNEAGFFIRDATNGSTLPLRIRPGAPSSAIDVLGAGGVVRLGTTSTDNAVNDGGSASLYMRRTDGNARVLIREASATASNRVMLQLENTGSPRLDMENVNTSTVLRLEGPSGAGVANFNFNFNADATNEAQFQEDGDLVILGDLTANGMVYMSDRDQKENFASVDSQHVLDLLADLQISRWNFRSDPASALHIGPMAQDFHALFGLGSDARRINVTDVAGINLAASKGLLEKVQEQEGQIGQLKAQIAELTTMIERLLENPKQ